MRLSYASMRAVLDHYGFRHVSLHPQQLPSSSLDDNALYPVDAQIWLELSIDKQNHRVKFHASELVLTSREDASSARLIMYASGLCAPVQAGREAAETAQQIARAFGEN